MLRADLLGLVLGGLLVAVGVVSGILYLRTLRRGGASLLWLGSFALLYGVRLLARARTFRVLFDLPPPFWGSLESVITYVVGLPALLVLGATFAGLRRLTSWTAVFLAAFAAFAIVADVALGQRAAANTANNLITIGLILVITALGFLKGWPQSREMRMLGAGAVAFFLAALADNLRNLGVLAWQGPEVEPLGFAVLIACLATMAAWRIRENAERIVAIDKELSIARQIQESILPRERPRVAGLDVAARYRPMTAVAGDFYDFVEVDSQRIGILVADVSGHGVPAALIASMVKVAIAAQKQHADRPAAVLAGMNETLCGRLGSQYVTAAYLYVDLGAGITRYGAAGHPPLLCWRPKRGRVDEIQENGLPLGLMDVAQYTDVEQALEGGERFVMYTDGLVEATNAAGDFFELARVKEALTAEAGIGADAFADLLIGRQAAWSGQTATDDLTLVVVDT
jgi:sigma-B regulation protein RsbU (phosphoserine phosphatase)